MNSGVNYLISDVLVSSADNLCNQFGPDQERVFPERVFLSIRRVFPERVFLSIRREFFLRELFKKVYFEKKSADDKKTMNNFPVGKEF